LDSSGAEGKIEEAEAALRQTINLAPDYSVPHHLLATALIFQGKLNEAEEELFRVARLDPDYPENYVRLGEIYLSRELTALAVTYLKRAVELSPFSASVHAELGSVYASLGRKNEAIKELKEAERLINDENSNTDQFLGQAYTVLNEPGLAVQHLGRRHGASRESPNRAACNNATE